MEYSLNESLMRFTFVVITTILPPAFYLAYKQATEWECSVMSYEFWDIGKVFASIFVLTYLLISVLATNVMIPINILWGIR